MNKKFFINILSLVLFFILFAFVVWPKISETLEVRKEHLAIKEEIADLDKTIAKIESLGQELEKNIEDQRTVSEYLPAVRGDEFLVNYLDSIALTEGISLSNIEIEKKEVNSAIETSLQAGNLLNESPKPIFETAKFDFFANYEKIVTLLRKFDNLKRFNKVSDLKITKIYPEDNKGDASLNFLQIKLSLDFNHLKKITSQSEIGEKLFAKDNFDQATLAKIKNKAINGANNPNNTTSGRSNPFIP